MASANFMAVPRVPRPPQSCSALLRWLQPGKSARTKTAPHKAESQSLAQPTPPQPGLARL